MPREASPPSPSPRPRRADPAEDLSLYKSPMRVLYHFGGYMAYKCAQIARGVAKRATLVAQLGLLAGGLYVASRTPGAHQPLMAVLSHAIKWYGYWIVLGILSSVGLGTGLHTFLLFLGPHIARVTSAAFACGHVEFATQHWGEVECNAALGRSSVHIFQVAQKIMLDAFFWGIGTALGELPPYFMAKAARESGDHHDEARDVDALAARPDHEHTWADWVKVLVANGLKRFGFWAILACASIPNPLFDLAGIICGSVGIPFATFFTATLLGKAVFKTGLQSLFVVTLFSRGGRDLLLHTLDAVAPALHAHAVDFLEQQTRRYLRKPGDSTDESLDETGGGAAAWLGTLWNWVIVGTLLFFALSIVESLANRHARRVARLSRGEASPSPSRSVSPAKPPRFPSATASPVSSAPGSPAKKRSTRKPKVALKEISTTAAEPVKTTKRGRPPSSTAKAQQAEPVVEVSLASPSSKAVSIKLPRSPASAKKRTVSSPRRQAAKAPAESSPPSVRPRSISSASRSTATASATEDDEDGDVRRPMTRAMARRLKQQQ